MKFKQVLKENFVTSNINIEFWIESGELMLGMRRDNRSSKRILSWSEFKSYEDDKDNSWIFYIIKDQLISLGKKEGVVSKDPETIARHLFGNRKRPYDIIIKNPKALKLKMLSEPSWLGFRNYIEVRYDEKEMEDFRTSKKARDFLIK
jgi:hypothetical protein